MDMPGATYCHGVCVVSNAAYVVGGYDANTNATSTVFNFNSASGAWSEVAPMPEGRANAAVCAIGTSIFVAGGYHRGYKDTLFKFDTEADEWNTLARLPATVGNSGVCTLGGKLYVVCGYGAGQALNTLYAFDPAVNAWSTLAPMPTARRSLGVFVRGGCIYAVGGSSVFGGGGEVNTVERYDPATNTWTAMQPFPNAISGLQCCTVTDDEEGGAERSEADFFDALISRAEAVGRRAFKPKLKHKRTSMPRLLSLLRTLWNWC